MPMLDVLLVLAPGAALPGGLAQAVADAAGRTLAADPGRVWVRLESLSSTAYAENEATVAADDLPAFVRLLHAHPPAGAAAAAEVLALTQALAPVLQRPAERVHVEYAPAGAGRMAFGGRFVA